VLTIKQATHGTGAGVFGPLQDRRAGRWHRHRAQSGHRPDGGPAAMDHARDLHHRAKSPKMHISATVVRGGYRPGGKWGKTWISVWRPFQDEVFHGKVVQVRKAPTTTNTS